MRAMSLPRRGGAAGTLRRRIPRNRAHLFLSAAERAVPATNNACERALRPSVFSRKATNGFRSEQGAQTCATGAALQAGAADTVDRDSVGSVPGEWLGPPGTLRTLLYLHGGYFACSSRTHRPLTRVLSWQSSSPRTASRWTPLPASCWPIRRIAHAGRD